MSILAALFGNAFGSTPLPGRLSVEEGFLDIDLPISSIRTLDGGTVRIEARGMVDGQTVGYAVELYAGWKHQPTEDKQAVFHWGSGSYRRTGPESDAFISLVANRYGLDSTSTLKMISEVRADVVGLDTDPSKASSSSTSMKFFFHSDDESRYAEVFTNIDIEKGLLEFHEKDNEYRINLVRALSESQ